MDNSAYIWLVLAFPAFWLAALQLAGAYDVRFMGVGSDEFRRVLNAGVGLTAAIAVVSYAAKIDLAREYVVIALPCMTTIDLLGRYFLRKRLHRLRDQGSCMRKVVVVGHPDVICDLAAVLRRDTYHGLSIVGACVVGADSPATIEGIPVIGGLHGVADVVQRVGADTVAVLACREMMGSRLRNLAWALEKTGTDLCVAPALLDVAGPRTSIRPIQSSARRSSFRLARTTACCSRCEKTRALPVWAAGSDATRSTNCPSWSTFSSGTCPWSGRVLRSRGSELPRGSA
jgi:FlaA1/EpsC-like NDP-sugar epimerase